MENTESQFYLIFLLALITATPIIMCFFKNQKKFREHQKAKYKELISNVSEAIKKNSIRNLSDLVDYIKGYEFYEILRIKLPYDLDQIINSVKFDIVNNNINDYPNRILVIDKLQVEIKSLIKETELQEPFKNVPSEERNLLIDVIELSNQKDNIVFVSKLHKLGDLIRIREELVAKSGKDNEESLRLAKQSKYLAIVFFIVSLILAIYPLIK